MKLIIDIPEDYKEGKYSPIWFEKVIKNGTPVTNEDDLISRKALKDFAYINKGNFNTVEGIREWIDNAPTVEPEVYMNGKDFDLYLEGYKQGKKHFERPQGEWITYNSYYHKCNKCNRFVGFDYADTEHGSWFNFCPNCGADMRKGGDSK